MKYKTVKSVDFPNTTLFGIFHILEKMGNLKLAVVIESPSDDAEFLLEKQKRPAKFGDEDYDSLVDSDLWDLPSTDLPVLESGIRSGFDVSLGESCSEEVDLKDFDVESTLNRVSFGLPLIAFFSHCFLCGIDASE